jgi:hypothetical protein
LVVILALAAVLVIGVAVFAFFFLNSTVKKGVETFGPKIAGVEVKLDGANLSVFSGSGALRGLFVGNPAGFKTAYAIKMGEVSVRLQPRSIFSDKIVIESVHVLAPEITFEGSLKGSNLSKIQENIDNFTKELGGSETQAKEAGTRKLQVNEFVMSGGKISLSATLLGGKALTVPLPEIRLKDLGTGPKGITPGEVVSKVFGALFQSVTRAVGEALARIDKTVVSAAEKVGEGASKGVEKVTKGVTDLFKKKK